MTDLLLLVTAAVLCAVTFAWLITEALHGHGEVEPTPPAAEFDLGGPFAVHVVYEQLLAARAGLRPVDVVVESAHTFTPCELAEGGRFGPMPVHSWVIDEPLHPGDTLRVGLMPSDALLTFTYCPEVHA